MNRCIICQQTGGKLTTTANGRIKVIEASNIRKDNVFKYLRLLTINREF